ncbi:hypothetical protein CEXT_59971 [Caerostris extrusa]|uniref:Uncharacterized protein n=1 Tax=Caerostris extrusa TaxID=172846 RepID=A0AAV4PD76_CAEEX|nr:hypothetical protein CEXT_59971 [Caerostris extrusa]
MGSIALNLRVQVVNFMFFKRWQWAKLKFAYLPHCKLEIIMVFLQLFKVVIIGENIQSALQHMHRRDSEQCPSSWSQLICVHIVLLQIAFREI